MKTTWLVLLLLLSSTLYAQDAAWSPTKDASKDTVLNGRVMETFEAGVKPEWGYAAPQQDTFVVLHPTKDRQQAPLYVVLHSAGHDVMSCVNCSPTVGNHDIYRSPDDHYAMPAKAGNCCRTSTPDGQTASWLATVSGFQPELDD